MSANRFYGITETAELKELEALEQKTKGHVFNYSFTAPVCLLDGYFYFLEVGDDSNYSLNRTEDDGTIKPVCYLNKTGGEWLPYLVSWSGLRQRQHDSIRIQLLQGNPVPEYRNRQSRLHILRRAGIFRRISPESPGRHTRKSAEILRGIHPCREEGLSGDSRRLYICIR